MAPEPYLCACGSYVHRLLATCLRCGVAQTRLADRVEFVAIGQPYDQLPTTASSLRAFLLAAGATATVVEPAVTVVEQAARDRPGFESAYARGLAHSVMTGDDRLMTYAMQYDLADRLTQGLQKGLNVIRFAYRGGVRGQPGPLDAAVKARVDALVIVAERSGRDIAQIPGWRLVSAIPFVEESAILKAPMTVGMYGGGAAGFSQINPTVTGGGITLAWITDAGDLEQLTLGNRPGIFAKKGKPEYFYGLADVLGAWADARAAAVEAWFGTASYEDRLGLSPPTSSPARPATSGPDVGEALRTLEALLDEGLISDDEFAARRSAILERL